MAHEADPITRARARTRLAASQDEQKRAFLRLVSHELRTPLNSILGFSEILSAELYGPLGAAQYKEYAAIIHGSGTKLLKLVNQVLEIARLEGRALDINLRSEPVDLALDDVLATLAPDLKARSVRVDVEARGGLPSVLADPRGLRMVLVNLLQNAIQFSPQHGSVQVRVLTCGTDVEIVIRDQGEGVDPAKLPRLKQPFEQAESALTRRSEGAGLGLPISDMTCKAMGGRLRLESAPGEGLTASVILPIA